VDDVEREECTMYVIALITLAPIVVVAAMRRTIDGPTFVCLTAVAFALGGLVRSVARSMRRVRPPRARVVCRRAPR
jgi:hypothetical protein